MPKQTLSQMAQRMSVSYRTLLSIKDHLGEMVPQQHVGRKILYPESAVDLFQLVLALQEEGYAISTIKAALRGETQLEGSADLQQWLQYWQQTLAPWLRLMADTEAAEAAGWTEVPEASPLDESPAKRNSRHTDSRIATQEVSRSGSKNDDHAERTADGWTDERMSVHHHHAGDAPPLEDQVEALVRRCLGYYLPYPDDLAQIVEFINFIAKGLGMEERLVLPSQQANPTTGGKKSGKKSTAEIWQQMLALQEQGRIDRTLMKEWVHQHRQSSEPVSYTKLVQWLNDYQIPTASGRGRWHKRTLQGWERQER